MRYFLLLVTFVAISVSVDGQSRVFLPEKNYWPVQTLNPVAPQAYGFMAAHWKNTTPSDYVLAGFGFGFQKAIFGWTKSETKGYDIEIEGAALTQFEFTHRTGVAQRNILSTDYRTGVSFVFYSNPWTIRFQIFHLSAHMGDDYIFRRQITSYHRNNVNYEQFDVTASYLVKDFRFYFGAGSVVRASQPRKPLVFKGGLSYLSSLSKKGTTHFIAGFYMDSKQDHGFIPAINVGAGIQVGKPERHPFKFMATYFIGPLPYSVYEGERVQWLGLGVYFNPF